jgi:hypothetical protein
VVHAVSEALGVGGSFIESIGRSLGQPVVRLGDRQYGFGLSMGVAGLLEADARSRDCLERRTLLLELRFVVGCLTEWTPVGGWCLTVTWRGFR